MDNSWTMSLAALTEESYQTWLWIDARVSNFPRVARRELGHRISSAVLDALVATTEAAYLRKGQAKTEALERTNRKLTVARILLRGARDRHYLSIDQHEHVMKLVDQWGRQVGGWLRAERRNQAEKR